MVCSLVRSLTLNQTAAVNLLVLGSSNDDAVVVTVSAWLIPLKAAARLRFTCAACSRTTGTGDGQAVAGAIDESRGPVASSKCRLSARSSLG